MAAWLLVVGSLMGFGAGWTWSSRCCGRRGENGKGFSDESLYDLILDIH